MKRKKFKYGNLLAEESQIFRFDLYTRIGLPNLFKNKKVLDVGCGYGIDSVNLLKFSKKVIGSDINTHRTWQNYTGKNITFVKSKSEKMPFKTNEFEGVYLKDLLHHVDDVESTLKEIKRIAKRGANIVIIEGNRYNPIFYFYATKLNGHEHFSQGDFKKLILKHFPKTRFLHLECYPPFKFNRKMYMYVLKLEKIVERFSLLKFFFSYNIAVIKK